MARRDGGNLRLLARIALREGAAEAAHRERAHAQRERLPASGSSTLAEEIRRGSSQQPERHDARLVHLAAQLAELLVLAPLDVLHERDDAAEAWAGDERVSEPEEQE